MIWQFASRYFWARKSTNAINIIAWVSVGAIAVGTAALIIVLSVFNGFEGLVKSLYSSFYPTLKVVPASGKTLVLTPQQLRQVAKDPAVAHYTQVIEEKAVLSYGGDQTIAVVKGVDDHYMKVANIQSKVIRGKFETVDDHGYRAVVGIGLETALGVDVEHSVVPVSVFVPRRGAGADFSMPEQALNNGDFYPAGTFALQQDFDSKYVLTHIDFMRSLLDMKPGEMSGLELALKPGNSDLRVKRRLQELLGDRVDVQTRYEQNKTLYNIMRTEKWVVYSFLSFILVVAAFNMLGSLSMLVLEKRKDITILKAMGSTNGRILRIFLAEGLIIAVIGSVVGIALALIMLVLQQQFGIIKLGGDSFLIDAFPVEMHAEDFGLVAGTVIVIGILASWLPARRAAAQPIDLKAT
ncbi:FtsX-like permease family protein [Chitinophaga horti]|uniref:FtsX-like permease family protein n=1 Tax=Chitinophaga horti TaxID=2920382 RepID=A0ABY6J0F5_9BACT|nr:FtsX-like permease family protein [Chitinophaga horti]UYQ93132.1 FtsX-like permease family protein [Chitinophaga horti]